MRSPGLDRGVALPNVLGLPRRLGLGGAGRVVLDGRVAVRGRRGSETLAKTPRGRAHVESGSSARSRASRRFASAGAPRAAPPTRDAPSAGRRASGPNARGTRRARGSPRPRRRRRRSPQGGVSGPAGRAPARREDVRARSTGEGAAPSSRYTSVASSTPSRIGTIMFLSISMVAIHILPSGAVFGRDTV